MDEDESWVECRTAVRRRGGGGRIVEVVLCKGKEREVGEAGEGG